MAIDDDNSKRPDIYRRIDELKLLASKDPSQVQKILPSALQELKEYLEGQSSAIEEGRMQAGEALQESVERYMMINDLAPFAICLLKFPEVTIEQINVAYERMFGLSREEAIGKTPDELGISLDPEGRACMFSEILKHGSANAWELEYATRSGEKRIGSFSFNLIMIGGQRYMLGTGLDITERKRAEEALRVSEEKYRYLFENMAEGFQILEPIFDDSGKPIDFRYIEVNRASEVIGGKKKEQIEGKTAKELWKVVEGYWVEMLGRVLKTGEPANVVNYSGELDLYYNLHAWKVDDYRVAILFTDITQRKKMEEALKESEERQTFLLGLSDALRPLSDPIEIQLTACRVLGEHIGASRVLYGDVVDEKEVIISRDYVKDVPSIAAHLKAEDYQPVHNRRLPGRGVRDHQRCVHRSPAIQRRA